MARVDDIRKLMKRNTTEPCVRVKYVQPVGEAWAKGQRSAAGNAHALTVSTSGPAASGRSDRSGDTSAFQQQLAFSFGGAGLKNPTSKPRK